jgi:tritrans,polycis-undecaprenyl-diphosphate synthase [geranylgeranyl-diphosphate specific]
MEGVNIPKHVAFIPDGNRRCAKRLLKKPWNGHEWGVNKIKTIFEWGRKWGIKTMTFYSLSLENMDKRPKMELDFLLRLAERELDDIINNKDNFVHKNRIHITFFGNLHLLPESLQNKIEQVTDITGNYRKFVINFALAYGGRQEIAQACRQIAMGVEAGKIMASDINEMMIQHNLQTNGYGDPDLIIRTGGEKRISNFLLFQSAYSELAFVDELWPEFSEKTFNCLIEEYSRRDRRFGK